MYKSQLFIISIFCLCLTVATYAADKEETYSLQKRTYDALSEIQTLMAEEKLQDALSKLQGLISKLKKPYDMAVANQTLGYVYYQLDKYKDAIKAFEKAIQGKSLPKDVSQEILYITAQLQVHTEDYQGGLKSLDAWFATNLEANAEAYILKANAHYQLEQFKEMIAPLKQALKLNKKAPTSWYELLLAAFFETKQYKNATSMLEVMIRRFPEKPAYWKQLISVYQLRKLDKKAMAIMELAYSKDYLESDQIFALAQNYLFIGSPYKGAKLLQEEMSNGRVEQNKKSMELLLTAWLMAKENDDAISTLKSLNNISPGPKYSFQLGQLQYEQQKWKDTISSLENVIMDKSFKNYAEANLLYGIASYELKKYSEALKAFKRSLKDKSTREMAKWWVTQIKESLAEQESLENNS